MTIKVKTIAKGYYKISGTFHNGDKLYNISYFYRGIGLRRAKRDFKRNVSMNER